MVKTHEEQKTISEEVIDDVICNRCGNSIHKTHLGISTTSQPHFVIDDYLEINKLWGYMSDHEGEVYNCHICQKCCYEIASTFKIPIKTKEVEF